MGCICNITTLLSPLTPPPGGKKCNMGIARGYTCYVTFSKAPPMNSHGNTLGGGPQGVEIVTYLRGVPKKYMLLFWVLPPTMPYKPPIALHSPTITYINLPYPPHSSPFYILNHSDIFWYMILSLIPMPTFVHVWTCLTDFFGECIKHTKNVTYIFQVGKSDLVIFFSNHQKNNIHFWGLPLQIWFINLFTQPKNVM